MMAPDAVHVWQLTLDDVPGEDALSPEELVRAGRFRLDGDRYRFMACRVALRTLLGTHLGVPARDVVLTVREDGKPCLDPIRHGRMLRFNASHSRDMAVIALAANREVGVDIEWQRPLAELDALVRRRFGPRERAAFAALPRAERPHAFFRVWTLKEAYLKGCGDGLRRQPEDIEIDLRHGEPSHLRRVLDRPGDETRWTVSELTAPEGYCAALACTGTAARLVQERTLASQLRVPANPPGLGEVQARPATARP